VTRQNRSLVAQLTQTLVVSVGSVWLLCLIGVGWYVSRAIDENFDNELVESAHRLIDTAVHELDQNGARQAGIEAPVLALQPVIEHYEPLVYQLLTTDGRVVVRTTAAPERAFGVPVVPGFADTGPWRIYTARHPSRPFFLQLADPLAERREALSHTLIGLVVPMLAMLPLLALLLSAIARRELRVLHQLKTEISQRNGRDLRPIAIAQMPRELQSVGDDINRLLERLSAALDVERALAANAAHELRTPLAAVRLRLQTALDEGLGRQDVQAALDALGILSHRTEKLLQLSRAESASSLGQSRVDLVQLAATVAQEFWQNTDVQRRLDLIVPDAELLPVLGDVDALAIALRNLVENALRYAKGAQVEIEVMAPSTLVVRDRGPGVDADRLATLQQRHVRHASDQAGYGLGLSIVGSIVQKHRGQLELLSPVPGSHTGLEARIILPAPEPAPTA
jgi:two-component system OmpR family sensor kinase